MAQHSDTHFDAVTALSQGARDHQEDAVVADFPVGSEFGVVVLSDGMGGHAAGDVASKIVMTEVFSELKLHSDDPELMQKHLPELLTGAATAANECIRAHISENPESNGMGATLVAAVINRGRLNWVSVGDSPLYLYRDGVLQQLNEDHSMAPQIDFMVESGLIDREAAMEHPDRNCLTSVLGGEEIERMDCPAEAFTLRDGDIVVAASDGLQFMENWEIEAILSEHKDAASAEIARGFLEALGSIDDPDQDNVSIAVVKISLPEADVHSIEASRVTTRPLPAEATEDDDEDDEPIRFIRAEALR